MKIKENQNEQLMKMRKMKSTWNVSNDLIWTLKVNNDKLTLLVFLTNCLFSQMLPDNTM